MSHFFIVSAIVGVFVSFATTPTQGWADSTTSPEIEIRAKALKAYDEVTYLPYSVSIEQPASDSYVGETLAKLPGVLVRNTSGFGSLTTVITAPALGARGTAVSVDDIPVLDPTGAGINFSLFPGTLLKAVEHHSPFYSTLNPQAETLSSPGGRINLRTLDSAGGFARKGEVPINGSLMYGGGNSIEATGAYRGGEGAHDWVAGVSHYNTAGDFHYKDPTTGEPASRDRNDAVGVGGIAKYRYRLSGGGSFELLDLASSSGRTNPGRIDYPSPAREIDTFNLLGLKYANPAFFSPRDGVFAKLAGAYARRELRSSYNSDVNATAGYVQAGYARRDDYSSITVAFDNEYENLDNNQGNFFRNVFGAMVVLSADVGPFRLIPMARQDAADKYDSGTDASMTVQYAIGSDSEVLASYGFQHIYPALTSRVGAPAAGLLPNPDLRAQRDSILSLVYNRRASRYSFSMGSFYDLVQDQTAFKALTPDTGQMVNASVWAWGATADGQLFPSENLALRASATFSRTMDRGTGRNLPYKPAIEGWLSASYLISRAIAVTAQENFVGMRYISIDSNDSVPPFAQTNLRLDASLWRGTLFFKLNNVFDAGAFESPGYPFMGRSVWLGYSL